MHGTRIVVVTILLALSAAAVCAHGNKKHVVGTIEKISGNSVVVKTSAGKSVEVQLVPATTYVQRIGSQNQSAKLSDLQIGDRVVIHATPHGERLDADEVTFSTASGKQKS